MTYNSGRQQHYNRHFEDYSIPKSSTRDRQARPLYRIALFDGLLNNNQVERTNALDNITRLVNNWAKECYPVERSTAGTVVSVTATGGKRNVSNASSPLSENSNNLSVTPMSSRKSSDSDDINPASSLLNSPNSPLLTDGSVSSYAASPVVDNGCGDMSTIPSILNVTNASDGDKSVNINQVNLFQHEEDASVPQRNGIPGDQFIYDGFRPYGSYSQHFSSHQQQRRDSADDNDDAEISEEEAKESLRLHLLTMLRMSIDCPFPDVRLSFEKCLEDLRMAGVPVPVPIYPAPSFYIAPEDILTLEWPPENTSNNTGITPSSSCSSPSSTSFSETSQFPQPITSSTPLWPLPKGRQPDPLVKNLLSDTFVNLGRLSHYYRVLAYFPGFMEKYQASYNIIVKGPIGPVPISWRFYIGIMAASQHKCQYIVSKLTSDFLINGGDANWLLGLQYAPQKIRNLATLNAILAHQPWRLQASHIGALVRVLPNNWTISEIVHVIMILSTFHSLSSFVLGCGIVPEYDSIGGYYDLPPWASTTVEDGSIGIMDSSESISPNVGSGLGITEEEQTEVEKPKDDDSGNSEKTPAENFTKELTSDVEIQRHTDQLIKRLKNKPDLHLSSSTLSSEIAEFENIEEETFTNESPTSDITLSPFLQNFSSTANTTSPTLLHSIYNLPSTNLSTEDFSRFLDPSVDTQYAYTDFVVNSSEYSVFKLQDYGWDHGVSMANRYFSGAGDVLDAEFAKVWDITDYCLFHSYQSSNIDTRPLRQAIWFYVQRLSGLLKDDYVYRDINTYLSNNFKTYLKKVSCKPEDIEYSDWKTAGFQLRAEEKCHVNLIAAESRKQAELIYGLSCVMKWYGKQSGDESSVEDELASET
ncbi:16231_t:CDS:2 [Funneliformis caledonium]|uniref:16231_t:CDS:1 n=1 Tax=Funneliformis caledonium TaxID=1117310 RepID=A0A9N8ZRX8_9GLOM|nr:16231_t:CDS:2 [Funneliformis caledonium]